ncbi:MAG: PP2C family protein-serine/threonine phosphatase [Candidatus Rifleibacteriota bacterium]
MKKNEENQSLLKRFPLLTLLGAVFCFLVVPFWLINAGLHRMLTLRSEKETADVFRQMDNRLEFLLRHTDDQRYFHAVFKRVFYRALHSSDPVKTIELGIKLLNKRFPGALKFIVWDENGRKVEHLSDEKSFHYIVKNIYQMFREVANHCQTSYPGYPDTLAIVTDKMHLYRSYLGRMLVAGHLRLPYQAGTQGACILADTFDRRPLFWFHAEPELTVYCSISGSILKQNIGLKHSIETLNREKHIDSGIISNGFIYPAVDEKTGRELLLELGKFENASLPHRQTVQHLLAFKMLSPEIRGFCRISRNQLENGFPEQTRYLVLGRLIFYLLVAAYVFFCFQLRSGRLKISIRLKLAILFLYANGLPLLILGTIGFEYMQQQKYNLIAETHAANEKVLLEIDSGYNRHRTEMGQLVQKNLEDFRQQFRDQQPGPGMESLYKQLLANLKAEEIHFFNQSGQVLASQKRHRKQVSQTFMKIFAAGAMTFANQKTDDLFDQLVENAGSNLKLAGKTVLTRGADILKTLISKMERIEYFNFGTQLKLCYATLLGDREGRNFHSMMLVVWREEEAQSEYIKQEVEGFNRRNDGNFLSAMVLSNGQVFHGGLSDYRGVIPVMQKAVTLQNFNEDSILVDGKRYIATAISGKALNNLAMIALSPVSKIEKEIETMEWFLMLAIFITLAISSGVVMSLSQQFLDPVRQLSEAVIQIGRRNFRFRTSIGSNDEFGDLGRTFNSSIAELEKLELGRIVQESLLPGNRFSQKSISVFARTVTMTRLGGDYYDFFTIDENRVGVFMGDVAGHGIPAALIMAMAKSSVLTRVAERTAPDKLLAAIHQMLFSLKNERFKRMMTCQYMTFDAETGKMLVANAGHCFPVIVSADGRNARYVEIIGTPVGIAKRARYVNSEIDLEPGETVILYSDGMVEANNPQSGPYGSDRFLALAASAWHNDLEQYYSNMYRANREWSAQAEDDLTIVLIRFAGKGGQNV